MPPRSKHIPSRVEAVAIVEVIRVETIRGCGQTNDDPVRRIIHYYTTTGQLIREIDTMGEEDPCPAYSLQHVSSPI